MRALLAFFIVATGALTQAQLSPAWEPFQEVKDGAARVEVVKALAKSMNTYTRAVIVGALLDPDRMVVDTAAAILRREHRPETFHALIAGMAHGSQYDAALLLSEYREPKYVSQLAALLRHKLVAVRRPAALALGLTGDRRALNPLQRALQDRDADVRGEVQKAIGRIEKGVIAAPPK